MFEEQARREIIARARIRDCMKDLMIGEPKFTGDSDDEEAEG
jgi:hypothetical protein